MLPIELQFILPIDAADGFVVLSAVFAGLGGAVFPHPLWLLLDPIFASRVMHSSMLANADAGGGKAVNF